MEGECLSSGQTLSDMVHRVLPIGSWVVDFLFAKLDYDDEGVLACLYEMDADYEVMRQVNKIMDSDKLNCGFTFANPDLKRALVVVGPSSSGKQFVNTLVHEVHHLAVAIADSLGHDLESEVPAYLSGDAAMALAETVCEFGCSHCRD